MLVSLTAPAFADVAIVSARAAEEQGRLEVTLTGEHIGKILYFALYSSGRVIFKPDDQSEYQTAMLSPAQHKAILHGLELRSVGKSPDVVDGFLDLYCVQAWVHGVRQRQCAGNIEFSRKVPAALVKIWSRLRHFEPPGATPWVPTRLGLLLLPSKPPYDSVWAWPGAWPRPVESPGDSLVAELPGTALPELERHAGEQVDVNGKKYHVNYQSLVPSEDGWR